jgi:PEP-CTERM motif-containing protein
MFKMKIASLLVLVVILASPIVAFGALLDGKTVEYQYFYPNNTTPYLGADNGNKVVGAGIEVTNIADNDGTLDISDTNLLVRYTGTSSWTSTSFNGFRIRDVFGTIAPFTGVTVNPATTMVGFGASRVTFDADQIWVNWNGLDFNPNTIVSLDIQSVPEPSTALLAALGLFAFGGRRRAR